MKTSLKALFATAMTAVVLSSSVLTSVAAVKSRELKVMTANNEIKKVIITGNTKVFLVQSKTEYVTMEEGDMDKVTVKQIGNELRISSSEKSPVTVTVYVRDIFRVDASNTCVVKTLGTFKLKYLQLILKDEAVARIKANTESLYTVINGHSNLELLGSTGKHILKHNGIGKLNTDKFAAVETHQEPTEDVMASTR
ncbi:GIN domain-containing protein [Pedobacter sp. L105]|uniref:GIN domain-containing protein n=1 Tax=Pedobacter sp. L105 TaxID=1641871 RepID=UPI00131C9D4D|nr:DUF2807 domain-containing protein [Pedobacter sp. L105]